MKYFLHDTNAFQDEKITELFMAHGYEGLGLFYSILEKLGQQEKPVKTAVLKQQLSVGKKLEKCWSFLESLQLISSNNGDTFNDNLLKFSEKYQVSKEKNREKVSQWREKQALKESVTGYVPVRNGPKLKISKVNTSYDVAPAPEALKANPAKLTAVALTDPDDEQPWSVGPLNKPNPFRVICERLGFLEIDFEHYRKQALVAAEDADISRTINQWSSWIRNYLNNQMKAGPLLKAAAVDLTRATPRHELPPAGTDCTGRHIVLTNTGDANMNRMFAANYQRDYPNATIHHIR